LAVATTNTGFVLFLHPAQERAEHPGRGAAVGGAAGLAAGEALFDFIDPQHAGRDGLGGLDDGAQVGFRLADDAAEDAPMSSRSKGRPKAPAVALAVRRFAGAGDADDQQAFGCGQAVGFGGFAEGTGAALQPFLEQAEAADVVERGGGFDDFDQAVLLQGPGFFAGDDFGSMPLVSTTDSAKAFSASVVVRPSALCNAASRTTSLTFLSLADLRMPSSTVPSSADAGQA
jgi:hypothetical protein